GRPASDDFRGGARGGQNFRRPLPGGRDSQSGFPKTEPSKPAAPKFVPPSEGQLITLKPPVIVRELAAQLKRKPFQLIADLMEVGVFATVNQSIDELVAQKICAKYGFRFEVEKRERGGGIVHAAIKKIELDIDDKPEELKPRAPVVTIMGHVDHGKTTLLDVIRKANVASGEAGGITQHIGAYTISFPHPECKKEIQHITFLDTPGHAAFSSMRARGANVTDLVILVVAANDGVMPQTLEALSHAQAAKVPILVAVNKIDHPNANPMKVRQQLQDKGLVPDDWGGDTIFVDCSALTKQGVDKLLEMILLQSDLLELKANPNRRAKGNVIESGLEPGGPTATVLVRKGTLRVGEVVICGPFWGKVRALINEEGARLKEAGPSVAVKLLGLNGVPEAGLEFSAVESEKSARDLGEQRAMNARQASNEARAKVTLENLFATLDATTAKVLRVVVKADTQGSVEAIVEALKKIEAEKVSLEVIHSAVGTITESDVSLASASDAIILGFHTRIDNGVSDFAKREGVQIKLYAIIYELIDQVKEAMAGLLDPVLKEVVIGSAEVRKIFELSKGGSVAGCMVSSGRIVRGKVRVMRRKGLIYEGVTQSFRRFQDEVNEVRAGMECGIRLDGFNEFQVGDAIECYTVEKSAPKL
ncbi:MAG: translation initiation factor IF-2, partial [Limisphaerales bacterium]